MSIAPTLSHVLPYVVFIPGTLCDGRIFKRQVQALRGKAQCIVLDYQRLRNPSQWSQRLLASLPPTFSVVGFSLGGLWALELLRRAPQRIQRLALIASNAQAGSNSGRRRSDWLGKLWNARGPGEVAKHVKPAYFHHEAKRRQHQSLVLDMAIQTTKSAAMAEFAWAAHRPAGFDALADFEGKLLVVSGAQDKLCPRSMQAAMVQAQPKAEWHALPHCGHFLPLEAPVKLSGLLLNWIKP